MGLLKLTALGLLAVATLAVALALWVHARDRARADRVWSALDAAHVPDPPLYDPQMVADLPEVGQRYFARAIAPGTPLARSVRLEMAGSFILNGNPLPMTARQILVPPGVGFVWQAEVGAGLMRFSGSDGWLPGSDGAESWTSFWWRGLVPLVRAGDNPDHARAAATRAMLEAIWVPPSLLPQAGAHWVQTGPNSAEIGFAALPGIAPMRLVLDAAGDPVEVWALRWTDANPDRVWRLQPFGGRVLETGSVGGLRIPTRVEMGNLFGTPDYAPFFLATVTRAEHR